MWRLKKYYKPFIAIVLLAICLLFVQALCELNLPNYLSKIVNTGIQASGIEQITPEAISENGMVLMTTFMNEKELNQVISHYQKIEKRDSNYIDKYPLIETANIYVLQDVSKEELVELDHIFSLASRTLMNVITEVENQTTEKIAVTEETPNTQTMDMIKMYDMLPILQNLPDEKIQKAKNTAEAMDSSMLEQIGVVFTKAFYDELGMDTAHIQTMYIVKTGAIMIGITLLGAVVSIGVGYMASKVAAGVSRNIRNDMFKKVERFSNKEFDKFSTASLITRTTNDVNQVQMLTVFGIRMLFFAPIMAIGGVIMMLQKSMNMSWILGVACIVIMILITVLLTVAMPRFKIVQKLIDKLNLVARENLTGIMVTRAFGTQKHEQERFDNVNKDLTQNNLFVNRVMAFMFPTMMFVMNIISVLIIWIGAHQIADSSLQVGDMMAFMQYAMQVIMSFLMISMMFIMIPRASVSGERIADVLETESSIKDKEETKKLEGNENYKIEFKHVCFKYDNADDYVLENINFVAKPGETTAIIGSTGSGKTTLINLIPRFYDVTEGEILINDIDIREVSQHNLHEKIGYVPQKGSLLSGTIESNLKYGNKEASDELMKQSAKIAQATEFIEEKENGFQSEISQSAKNVSGGQKQRLSIARALVTEAPIYIFDDSFSALDFKTDSNLRAALKENTNDNTTIIIVAQRVSTIMNAEQIIVLDQGKIVGKGTHKELLKNCPTYYEIASSQLTKEEL